MLRRRFAPLLSALPTTLVCMGWPANAAADCATPSKFAGCLDADPVWLSASPGEFALVNPTGPPQGQLAATVAFHHSTNLVTLAVAAPDPEGRELPIVSRSTTTTLATTYRLGSGAALSLALPLTLDQRGTGIQSISSQAGGAPPQRPLRDARLGFTSTLWKSEGPLHAAVAGRYVFVAPLGDEDALAGNRGFVGAPSFTMSLSIGRVFAGAEIGARLRQPTRLANARLGSQLTLASGFGAEILTDRRLTVAAEAFLAPTLVAQPARPSGGRDRLTPAEWLLSLRSTPIGTTGPTLLLGGGGSLPLSTTGGDVASGMTSPDLRFVAMVRQALVHRAQGGNID